MAESIFHFKRFSIRNEKSGLKVGTDGVLLGACTSLECLDCQSETQRLRILDIGTGTGLIALMLAQRTDAMKEGGMCSSASHITGIDIDADSAAEAAQNFQASPWAERLESVCVPLQEFKCPEGEKFHLIASNPPFFENSLKAPDAQRSTARHTDSLSYREIVSFAASNMALGGTLAMILPSSEETALIRYAASFGLFPKRVLSIRTTAAKAPKRMIVELGNAVRVPAVRQELVLMEGGEYTAPFRELTRNFYLR